jgi:hypothetical protein
MPTETLRCSECNQDFPFTEGEQQFFEDKGFDPPKRCKPCREKSKARRENKQDMGARVASRH